MNDFQAHKQRLLQNPDFRREYEALQPEYSVIRALIGARIEQNMTQEQLAEKSGVRQSNISRIENGICSPTLETLERLAAGLGKTLRIEFI